MGSIRGKLAALAYASKAAGMTDETDDFRLNKNVGRLVTGRGRETGYT